MISKLDKKIFQENYSSIPHEHRKILYQVLGKNPATHKNDKALLTSAVASWECKIIQGLKTVDKKLALTKGICHPPLWGLVLCEAAVDL